MRDPYALLGMTVLMLLLEIVDLLVIFTQKRDIYICDFVAALKITEGSFLLCMLTRVLPLLQTNFGHSKIF